MGRQYIKIVSGGACYATVSNMIDLVDFVQYLFDTIISEDRLSEFHFIGDDNRSGRFNALEFGKRCGLRKRTVDERLNDVKLYKTDVHGLPIWRCD